MDSSLPVVPTDKSPLGMPANATKFASRLPGSLSHWHNHELVHGSTSSESMRGSPQNDLAASRISTGRGNG